MHTIDYLEKYKVDGEGRAINDYQVEVHKPSRDICAGRETNKRMIQQPL